MKTSCKATIFEMNLIEKDQGTNDTDPGIASDLGIQILERLGSVYIPLKRLAALATSNDFHYR